MDVVLAIAIALDVDFSTEQFGSTKFRTQKVKIGLLVALSVESPYVQPQSIIMDIGVLVVVKVVAYNC